MNGLDADAEERVRDALLAEFHQQFAACTLAIGTTLNGQAAHKSFDAVSNDHLIIAMVKNFTADNEQGNQTRLARLKADLYDLVLEPNADRKFMYVSAEFHAWLMQQGTFALADQIELRIIPAAD